MSQTSQQPLPYAITQKLDQVRAMLRSYLSKKWLCMSICWLLLVYWLGAAIDYLPVRVGSDETPRAVRIVFLGLMVLGCLWLLLGWLLPRLVRKVDDDSLALLIERQHPELANRLITSVQVTHSSPDVADQAAHGLMLQRVLDETGPLMSQIDLMTLFRWNSLRRLQFATVVGLVITIFVAVLGWPWFWQWNARLFALSDTPWPRSAALRADWLSIALPTFTGQLSAELVTVAFDAGIARVPLGSSPRLQISADANAPKLPEVCTMHYRGDDGLRGRANLRRIGAPRDGWQQFNLDGPPLDSISTSLSMDIIGLDARLRDFRVQVVQPVVVMELQVECTYPAYLIDALSTRPRKEVLVYRNGMKIPEGTDCTLVGKCNALLGQVDYVQLLSASSDEVLSPSISQALTEGAVFRIPIGKLVTSQLIEIRLRDEYGLPADQVLRYNLAVQTDSVPEVQSKLEGIGLAVTPRAILPIRGKATDDHEIAQVTAELSLNENVLPPFALRLDDSQISGEIDLERLKAEQQISVDVGMTLGIAVTARDLYDLDGKEHIGRGQPQQLSVVQESKLIVILDRQELELRQRLEQIISELRQMHDSLDTINEPIEAEDPSAQLRLAQLKAQQSQLQTDKSRQELASIVVRVENLRLQLVNNRIDSIDRQQRLLEKVERPLANLLSTTYGQLEKLINGLQIALVSNKGERLAEPTLLVLDQILVVLESVKASMLELEGFNDIVDMVRSMLDEQERVLKATEEAQSQRVLDIFKEP